MAVRVLLIFLLALNSVAFAEENSTARPLKSTVIAGFKANLENSLELKIPSVDGDSKITKIGYDLYSAGMANSGWAIRTGISGLKRSARAGVELAVSW